MVTVVIAQRKKNDTRIEKILHSASHISHIWWADLS